MLHLSLSSLINICTSSVFHCTFSFHTLLKKAKNCFKVPTISSINSTLLSRCFYLFFYIEKKKISHKNIIIIIVPSYHHKHRHINGRRHKHRYKGIKIKKVNYKFIMSRIFFIFCWFLWDKIAIHICFVEANLWGNSTEFYKKQNILSL